MTNPNRRRFRWRAEIILALVLIVSPFVLPAIGGTSDTLSRILIWGLFGLGFDLIFGFTGLLSFGQAAFYGSGGFIASYLLVSHAVPNVFLALLLGMVGATIAGLIVGALALRRSGIYLAMITVAFGEMFFFLENSALYPWTGGENGLPNVPKPSVDLGGFHVAFDTPWAMYGLLAGIFFVGYVVARRIISSPFGHVLTAIRDNPLRAGAVGHAVFLYKLSVFAIAAAYAGLAGGLEGVLQGYMSPEAFTFDTSGQLVIQTVIGGAGTLLGPLVGAALWLYLRNELQSALGLGAAWKLVLGVVFVVLIVFLRHGIVGGLRDLRAWLRRDRPAAAPEPAPVVQAVPAVAMAPAARRPVPTGTVVIETRRLGKHFGGIVANADIDFSVNQGEIRGLIGPNGAGKSTFFKMLTGEVTPSTGHIFMFGAETTGLNVTQVCQRGIAKSYQINQLFSKLTVRRNLMISALSRARGEFRLDLFRDVDHMDELNADIAETLRLLDLTARADTPVAALAYGEKRRIEIGLALGTNPKILLLDEPLAGMSPLERSETVSLLKQIAEGRTLVMVEHDMDALFGMVDRVTVLSQGRILAEGTPAEVQGSDAVQSAYLGGIHA
ncbi:MAG: branched-chain amino acid ABC transporter ATP-binding protein/permease [Devosia sp.]|nr:branched-chain amino acid ABC transporter ATP-binding protein/permease [Devosia sp.]